MALRGRKPKSLAEKRITGTLRKHPVTPVVPEPPEGGLLCPLEVSDNPRAAAAGPGGRAVSHQTAPSPHHDGVHAPGDRLALSRARSAWLRSRSNAMAGAKGRT